MVSTHYSWGKPILKSLKCYKKLLIGYWPFEFCPQALCGNETAHCMCLTRCIKIIPSWLPKMERNDANVWLKQSNTNVVLGIKSGWCIPRNHKYYQQWKTFDRNVRGVVKPSACIHAFLEYMRDSWFSVKRLDSLVLLTRSCIYTYMPDVHKGQLALSIFKIQYEDWKPNKQSGNRRYSNWLLPLQANKLTCAMCSVLPGVCRCLLKTGSCKQS